MQKQIIVLLLIVALIICKKVSFNLKTDSIVEWVNHALDTTANPCEDFYQFACGGWIKNATIPSDSARIFMADSLIDARKIATLKDVLQNDPTIDPSLKLFFSTCMNTEHIEKSDVISTVNLFFSAIENSVEKSTVASMFKTIGWLHTFKVFPFFEFHVEVDAGSPQNYLGQFGQAGLNLPDKSLYLDSESAQVRELYVKHISEMFKLMNLDNPTARANDVMLIETSLARIQIPNYDLRDPFKVYNKLSAQSMQLLTPNMNWTAYFSGANLVNEFYNVQVPVYFRNLSTVITAFEKSQISNYLKWCFLHSIADYLPSKFVNETFNFYGKVLLGEDEMPERLSTCMESTDESMGMLLSQYFVKKTFGGEAKKRASEMLMNIKMVFKSVLDSVSWMDEVTRQRALLKLSQIEDMVGYPDEWPTYSFNVTDDYLGNKIAARFEAFAKDRISLRNPVNRKIWQMTPETINAYYEPTLNEMVFPAAMMQYPYFDKDLPIPVNYGGIGAVQGHELIHSMDDQGRLYDGTGKLINWWTEQSSQRFVAKSQCFVKQYNKFELLPGYFVNGNLTLGENIADNAGLKDAYIAVVRELGSDVTRQSIVPQFTNIQLFFVSFAQSWCQKAREESMKQRLLTDVHSPPKFRVIGTLQNTREFSDVFQCPVGSPMNPETKCDLF